MRNKNVRPRGFPPGLWVAMGKPKTKVTTKEQNEYPKMMTMMHNDIDLVMDTFLGGCTVVDLAAGFKRRAANEIH